MSSDFMWRPFDVAPFGLIYAGAQKNLGPSGLVVAIIRDDFLALCSDKLPSMLQYRIHADKNSLFNTPPCFSIYILRNVLAYNKSIGGLDAIYKNNLRKGELLYGCIDRYRRFIAARHRAGRPLAHERRLLPALRRAHRRLRQGGQGARHGRPQGVPRSRGIRVSMYNAVTVAQVETLVTFMESFAKKHA